MPPSWNPISSSSSVGQSTYTVSRRAWVQTPTGAVHLSPWAHYNINLQYLVSRCCLSASACGTSCRYMIKKNKHYVTTCLLKQGKKQRKFCQYLHSCQFFFCFQKQQHHFVCVGSYWYFITAALQAKATSAFGSTYGTVYVWDTFECFDSHHCSIYGECCVRFTDYH